MRLKPFLNNFGSCITLSFLRIKAAKIEVLKETKELKNKIGKISYFCLKASIKLVLSPPNR